MANNEMFTRGDLEEDEIVHPRGTAVRVVRINVNYTHDQQGQVLRNEHTIRATNGVFIPRSEAHTFRPLSRGRCPTYGTCIHCLASGPVGKLCTECRNIPDTIYRYLVIMTEDRIVDSEFISAFARRPHKIAMSDRLIAWLQTPSMDVIRNRDFVEWMEPKVASYDPNSSQATRERDRMLIHTLVIVPPA